MSDLPIIFSTPMVRALLEGRKTQTRRVLKLQPDTGARFSGFERDGHALFTKGSIYGKQRLPYAPGDRLYVREAIDKASEPGDVFYRADYEVAHGNSGAGLGWRPSIHMPRWASRITLIVTEVRVERLQDCSEADAIAEGISAADVRMYPEMGSARLRYQDIWDHINGPGAWAENPWVCAITFTVQRGNIDQIEASHE